MSLRRTHGTERLRGTALATPLVFGLMIGLLTASRATAQMQTRSAPGPLYNATFSVFYEGNYRDALDAYETQARSAINFGGAAWIDSICYLTMIGECHYQMGNYPAALKNYTAALQRYLEFPDWMQRVQFDTAQIRPVGRGVQTPWGISTRGTQLGRYPETLSSMQGQLDVTEQVRRGGVITPAVLYPVQPIEIVRATALAMRRRTELLGPLAKYDTMGGELLNALSKPVGRVNHWSQCWVDLQLGLAALAASQDVQAEAPLKRSLAAAGQFDHPMTGMALLELGRMALRRGDQASASKLFLEASYSAYHYADYNTLEEAFRYGALVHLLANEKGVYAPLGPALAWARSSSEGRNCRQLRTSLALLAAENNLVLGQTAQANALLAEAQLAAAKRTMLAGSIGARLNWLRATQWFQERKVREGEKALAAALQYMQNGSLWLFQIAEVNQFVEKLAAREGSDLAPHARPLPDRPPRPAPLGLGHQSHGIARRTDDAARRSTGTVVLRGPWRRRR